MMQNEADALLPNDAFVDIIVPSKRHGKRMKRLFLHNRSMKIIKRGAFYVRKSVAIIFMALGVFFGGLMFNPQVRAAVVDFMIEVYEQFTHFSFTSEDTDTASTRWYLSWLPEGFELVREIDNGNIIRHIYADKEGHEIRLLCLYDDNTSIDADNEHRSFEKMAQGKIDYYYGVSTDETGRNQVVWKLGETKFILESTIKIDVLLEIAKGIIK